MSICEINIPIYTTEDSLCGEVWSYAQINPDGTYAILVPPELLNDENLENNYIVCFTKSLVSAKSFDQNEAVFPVNLEYIVPESEAEDPGDTSDESVANYLTALATELYERLKNRLKIERDRRGTFRLPSDLARYSDFEIIYDIFIAHYDRLKMSGTRNQAKETCLTMLPQQ